MSDRKTPRIEWTRPLVFLAVFIVVGLVVTITRQRFRYLAMFASFGGIAALTEYSQMRWPEYRQRIRIGSQCVVGGILFVGLSLVIGINFQFSQIFFDACGGIVTGALIQLLIARVFLPFLLGNAFCSRACWDAPFFELLPGKESTQKPPRPRSEFIAWSYLVAVVVLTIALSFLWNPASNGVDLTTHANDRRLWSGTENLLIVIGAFLLVPIWGRRAYCRMLCPFLTISRVFARYSVYKIATMNNQACTQCEQCNRNCPMLIDVMDAVSRNTRVLNRDCIVCERCVDACKNDCLKYQPGAPWN